MQSQIPSPPGTYTPGYSRLKLAMILYGIMLVVMGLVLIGKPLRLVVFGKKAEAEATRVIKTKQGLPATALVSNQQVQANLEPNDYSYVFWNEFAYPTEEGRTISIRCPVGSRLKPLEALVDAEGLPSMEIVYYDTQHPDQAVFPFIVSTWFAAGALMIVGLLCAVIGGILYYWAEKPIPLPHLPAP